VRYAVLQLDDAEVEQGCILRPSMFASLRPMIVISVLAPAEDEPSIDRQVLFRHVRLRCQAHLAVPTRISGERALPLADFPKISASTIVDTRQPPRPLLVNALLSPHRKLLVCGVLARRILFNQPPGPQKACNLPATDV
jgi:hypothetical protein